MAETPSSVNFNWPEAAQKLRNFLDASWDALPPGPIAVACSGGADSLAALLLTWASFPETRKNLCVLHYDHAVRATSAEDAAFVRKVCRALEIEYAAERRKETDDVHSEAELRKLRLDFFKREMDSRKIAVLIQGHQRDDIAENMLMRLTRGSGTEGLAAPRKLSRQADGRIFVRPLLDISKETLLDALRRCGIPWCEDSTNAENEYFRNRIRNRVLPELREAAPFENIARSRKLLEEDADALDFFAEQALGKIRYLTSDSEVRRESTNDCCLSHFPKAVVRRCLRKILSREKIVNAGAAVIDTLVESIVTEAPQKIQLGTRKIIWDGKMLKFVSLKKLPETMVFEQEKITVSERLLEQIRSGLFPPTETVFLAGHPEIVVRTLLPGERFRPLGAPGEKPVRRIFTDKKIPENLRKSLPVFADGTGIAWIPGLPPAERFRIIRAGCAALRLTYRNASLV